MRSWWRGGACGEPSTRPSTDTTWPSLATFPRPRLRRVPPLSSPPRAQSIDDLSGVPGLTSLWLGRNKITELTGLDAVPGLTQLGLQSNRLTSLVPGLAPVVGLRELYVSHNGLTSLEGIGHLVRWWAGAGLLRAMGLGRDVGAGPAHSSLESHCRGAGEVVADALLTRYSLLSSFAFFCFFSSPMCPLTGLALFDVGRHNYTRSTWRATALSLSATWRRSSTCASSGYVSPPSPHQ